MPQITDGDFFEQVSLAFQASEPDVASKQREAAHVRRIQLLYHAIARGAFEEALDLTTDDFVLEICGPAVSPFNGRWQGHEEVLAAMKRNFSQVEDQRPQIQSVVAQGDIVILTAREQGSVCATGKCYDVQWMQEFTFAGGKIQRVRELIDRSADMGEE
jgi:ketosteroid isomerase-like protein